MAETFTDQEIIEGLLKRDETLTNRIVSYLYKYQPSVRHMVTSNSGSVEDAEDVFQEILILFLNQVWSGRFKLITFTPVNLNDKEKFVQIKTYVYRLAYNVWLKKLARSNKQKNWESEFLASLDNEDEYTALLKIILEEDNSRLNKLNDLLNEDCIKILEAFYFQKKSIKEIAKELGKTEVNVKVSKYRCIEKLKNIIKKWN